jgi:hypothetical protein
VPVLGMLLMVLVFSIERFFISQAAGKTKWTLYDKDTTSIKQGEIDEAIVKQQQGCTCN